MPDQGNQADLQSPRDVKVDSEFGSHERRHRRRHQPAAQQIGSAMALLQQGMHHIQKLGSFLNLVDHDGVGARLSRAARTERSPPGEAAEIA